MSSFIPTDELIFFKMVKTTNQRNKGNAVYNDPNMVCSPAWTQRCQICFVISQGQPSVTTQKKSLSRNNSKDVVHHPVSHLFPINILHFLGILFSIYIYVGIPYTWRYTHVCSYSCQCVFCWVLVGLSMLSGNQATIVSGLISIHTKHFTSWDGAMALKGKKSLFWKHINQRILGTHQPTINGRFTRHVWNFASPMGCLIP